MSYQVNAQLRRALKRGVGHLGFDVRRSAGQRRPDLIDFLYSREVDLVLDVGGNVGQFGRKLRRLGYRGRILSFEPLEEQFAELRMQAEQDGNWECRNWALGSAPGQVAINVSANTVFSSILPRAPQAEAFDAETAVLRTEMIEVRRLDDVMRDLRADRPFLKIDTQGFEKQVLDGAGRYLAEVVGLQLELPLVHLYQHSWTLAGALAYLAEAGFVLCQAAAVNYRRDDPVSLLEMDGLFRRVDAGDAMS